eukprot:scaffold23456_cov144-Cylindrotheca_fusiformis.AAC.6
MHRLTLFEHALNSSDLKIYLQHWKARHELAPRDSLQHTIPKFTKGQRLDLVEQRLTENDYVCGDQTAKSDIMLAMLRFDGVYSPLFGEVG